MSLIDVDQVRKLLSSSVERPSRHDAKVPSHEAMIEPDDVAAFHSLKN